MTIGAFTIENGTVSGPETYMREQGLAWLRRLNDGIKVGHVPVVVEHGYRYNREAGKSADEAMDIAILVAIQTDYAGWRGMRQMFGAAR